MKMLTKYKILPTSSLVINCGPNSSSSSSFGTVLTDFPASLCAIFNVFPEKIQTKNKFRRLCLWCDVALCLLNSVFTTNESRSAEMSFGFQHLTLLESATHMTPNERFSPHELQWNSRKFVVEWDEYGEMHKMMEKYHQKNNLNLCIFPISASKIFTMVKSRLKNIERGTCFIVVVNSMHQCYWFYRWIVWRVRCQM